jgi:hypothetical protein
VVRNNTSARRNRSIISLWRRRHSVGRSFERAKTKNNTFQEYPADSNINATRRPCLQPTRGSHGHSIKGKGIPVQAWEGSWGSRRLRLLDLLDTRLYEGGKVVTLTHRLSLPSGSSWYSFTEAESTPGHMVPSKPRKKSQAKPPGIDPETLRLVAQCLNQYVTQGPTDIM